MSTLVSPGVSVSVIDESFYSAAGNGTVPLFVIATAKNKSHPSGTGTASGTVSGNKMTLVTSQRELLTTFGNPIFKTTGGTPIHGHNLNEYGLLAAHSYMGANNRAFILRGDVDLAELEGSASAPTGDPADGSYWLDLANSTYGIYERVSGNWVFKGDTVKTFEKDADLQSNDYPIESYGKNGDYAVTGKNNLLRFYQKTSTGWQILGRDDWVTGSGNKDFQFASHLRIPTTRSDGSALQDGDVYVRTSAPNKGTSIVVKVYSSASTSFIAKASPIFDGTDSALSNYNNVPAENDLYVLFDSETDAQSLQVANFRVKKHNGNSTTSVTGSQAVTGTGTLTASNTITINGSTITFATLSGQDDIVRLASQINASSIANIEASVASDKLTITNSAGKDITISGTGTILTDIGLPAGTYSNWSNASFTPSASAPTGATPNGRLWYDSRSTTIDLVEVFDAGSNNGWRTYSSGTVTKSSQRPSAPSANDIWIDTSKLEDYPVMYKWDGSAFIQLDITDQSSSNGVLFTDFRPEGATAFDSDAPNADNYPLGMVGWNTRGSGYVVKKYNTAHPDGARWVLESGLRTDGSAYFGRHAQKKVITKAMQAALVANQEIRQETTKFNLMLAPGFPELIDEMNALNVERKETAFIIADTPFRLQPNGVASWATNGNNAPENGEKGLLTTGPNIGVYYPSGFATNVDGNSVMVPPSHIAVRTYAYNDSVAFPWFAPAGFQRGLVNNATSVGYLDDEGEFVAIALTEGQRDVLYTNKINPIANLPNKGLVVFGQKTLQPVASALDRVNVARLINYLRVQFDEAAKPFLFEPNDAQTRRQVLSVFNNLLGDVQSKRGLFDFLVVCDTTNNTPIRIDRNELYIDIAIQPIKAVEFIYIPVRIKNTGEDLASAG